MNKDLYIGLLLVLVSIVIFFYILYKKKQKMNNVKLSIIIKAVIALLASLSLGIYLILENV